MQGTSRENIYDEWGLYSLAKRRWRSKLIFFYKIVNHLPLDYLYSYLDFYSKENYHVRSASTSPIKFFSSRAKSFKKSFFPAFHKWMEYLTVENRNIKLINIFE